MKSLKVVILTLLMLPLTLEAQTVIEGSVTDTLRHPVEAYVTVAPKGTSSILDFADTDAQGHYRLTVTATTACATPSAFDTTAES